MPSPDNYTVIELYGLLQHLIMTGRGGYRIKSRGKNHAPVYLTHEKSQVTYVDLETEQDDGKKDGYVLIQA